MLKRCVATLLAVWLTVATVGLGQVHVCPKHSAAPGSQDHGGGAGGGHHDHGPAPDRTDGVSCQCLGSCTLAAAPKLVSGAEIAATVRDVADPGLPEHEYLIVERSHRLPFSNGPPSPHV